MHVEMCHLLRCPTCKSGKLALAQRSAQTMIQDGSLRCVACGANFEVQDGIPILLEKSVLLRSSDLDFSNLDSSTRQKIAQREWHDHSHIDDGDEYKQSAYKDPGLFAFLLHYQLREVERLLAKTRYSRTLNICCGHGFELDYLSQLSVNVLLADISPNSLRKALTKAKKMGIQAEALCCDAENLPLRDGSFDLVLTHHSLHHLASPMAGVEEMVRVSNSRIAFFEPAKGLMRSLVRASGLKPSVEESGNSVYEFSRKEVRELCRRTGADLRYFRKCLITGPTSEPRMFKRLDAIRVSSAICSGITLANRFLGNAMGTKCSVVIDKTSRPG